MAPDRPVLYAGLRDCLRKTYRSAGLRGLYDGLLPTLLKVVPGPGLVRGSPRPFTKQSVFFGGIFLHGLETDCAEAENCGLDRFLGDPVRQPNDDHRVTGLGLKSEALPTSHKPVIHRLRALQPSHRHMDPSFLSAICICWHFVLSSHRKGLEEPSS